MNIMGIVLPVAAFLIAGLLVAALWLWWGGGESEQQTVSDPNAREEHPLLPERDALNDVSTEVHGFQVLPSTTPGRVRIQVAGKTYTHINEITDEAVRNQIRLQIQALREFADFTQEHKPPPPIAPKLAPEASSPSKQLEVAPTTTIAEQIEIVLQERLLTLPHLNSRAIHILNTIDGGVQIKVDEMYYDSVNDVQDEEIKSVLQGAIQEWEIRTQLS